MQHLSEVVTREISSVEPFAELRPAGAVHGTDIFNDAVDGGPHRCTLRDGGDADGSGDAEIAEGVDGEEFKGEPEEETGNGHGEKADGR